MSESRGRMVSRRDGLKLGAAAVTTAWVVPVVLTLGAGAASADTPSGTVPPPQATVPQPPGSSTPPTSPGATPPSATVSGVVVTRTSDAPGATTSTGGLGGSGTSTTTAAPSVLGANLDRASGTGTGSGGGGGLAFTGTEVGGILLAGAVATAGGAALLAASRSRADDPAPD